MGATLKDLYNALKKDGRFTEAKDFGTFSKKMNERGYSSMVYNTVRNAGADVPDIATFRKNLGLHVWKQGEGRQKTKPTSAVGKAAQSVGAERWGDTADASQGTLLSSLNDKSSWLVEGLRAGKEDADEDVDLTARPASYGSREYARQNWEKMNRQRQKMGEAVENAGREYTHEEERRQSRPMADTGNRGANQYIVKTQGQWEKDIDDSGKRIVGDKSVSDYLSDAIFGEFKKAEENAQQAEQNVDASNVFVPALGASLRRTEAMNEETDPEKLLKNLQEKTKKSVSTLFSTPQMKASIEKEAMQLGIPVDYYVQNVLAPKLQERLSEEFDKAFLEKNLPKSTTEYVLSGIGDSLIGTLGQMATTTKKQREYMQRANAMTEEGLNPHVKKPGTWTKALRGAVGFVADAPVFAILSPVGGAVAGKVFGTGLQMTARIANASWYGRMGLMAGQGAVSQGTTGFLYGGLNSAVQNYSTGEDTSLSNTARVALGGGFSEGASWSTMGAFGGFVGGGLYKVGRNGGKNKFWNGAAKVGSDVLKIGSEGVGMHLGGNVAKTVRGEDTNWFSTEGVLEDCANVVALKLSHAHKFLGKAAGIGREKGEDGKRESYKDFVLRNIGQYILSDAAKGARFKFTEDEKKEFRPYVDTYYADTKGLLRTKNAKASDADNKKIKTVYDQIMADGNISWDAKAKYNALVMGTAPSVRPMMDSVRLATYGDKKVVEERAKDGTLLSRATYDTADERDAEMYRLTMRKYRQRVCNAFNGLLVKALDDENIKREFLKEKGYDFDNPENPKNKEIERLMANARENYYKAMGTDKKSQEDAKAFKEWFDFAFTHGGLIECQDAVCEKYGITADELSKIVRKEAWKLSNEELEIQTAYGRLMESKLFPENTVHEEQARQSGKDVAEENGLGSETPNNDAVKSTLAELTQAEDGLTELMSSSDVFVSEYKRLREQGLSNAQIYQELINSGMTQEELAPFAKYINANSKAQGMVQGTQQKIDETANKRVSDWGYNGTLNGEKQSGENMVYVTDDKGRTLAVASGDVAFDSEGNAKEDVGDMLVVYDTATGEMDFVSARDVKFHSTESAEDYKNRFIRHLQELNSQAYVEAQQEQQGEESGTPQQTEGNTDRQSDESTGNKPQATGNEGGDNTTDTAGGGKEQSGEGNNGSQGGNVPTFKDGTPIPMTTDSKGREVGDLTKMTPEQGAEYLDTTLGEMAGEFVDGKVKAAEKAVDKAKKKKVDMSGDAADVQEAIAKKNEAIAKAQAELDMYTDIKKAMTEKRVKATLENTHTPETPAESEGIENARKKFESGPRLVGNRRTRTLPDGTKVKGHYEIVESESLTPSHDANDRYKKNKDFPVDENGRTINDRDYETDKDAQSFTDEMANGYDGRGIDYVPVVTADGIVVDGNGRTMAGQKAAKNGTDGAYVEALKENAENFGFTAEQIEKSGIVHPRIVLVADEPMPYDTATFAKFNRNEKKSQDNTHQAVANAKKLTPEEVGVIVSEIDGAGSLDAFFNNPSAINSLLKRLVDKGVIGSNDIAGLREGENKLSAAGKDFVKNLLLGSVFSEDTIRMMGNDAGLKNKALNGIRAVIDNMKLGEYALGEEIDKAMQLLYEARQSGGGVDALLRTVAMIEENAADRYEPISQAIALALEGKAGDFRELLTAYNRNAGHYADPKQMEMFGDKPTKEEFVKEFLKFINWKDYATRHADKEGAGDAGGTEGNKPKTAEGNGKEEVAHNASEDIPAETQEQVDEAVKGVALEITKRVGEDLVVTDEGEAEQRLSEDGGESQLQFSKRERPAPKKTQKVYKLMRLGEDGKLYPLFIDSTAPTELGVWYDADSPDLSMLRNVDSGVHLVNPKTGEVVSYGDFYTEHPELFKGKQPKYPSKEALKWAADRGMRFVFIEDTEKGQKRFGGENRKYWNLGLNGSGAVSPFSMRPGWHAGSLPTMRQIGKGKEKNLRDDRFVWVEGEVSADKDYTAEAEQNPDKDLPDRIPEDGYYMKATNADKAKSQADRVGWYVAGAFKANRIMSDREARSVIDKWNEEHPDKPVEYDYERESGREFNAETMSLEDVDGSTPKRMEFRTKDGEVYGFTDGKKIYLDTKKMKPETPLHEYTHLWGAALRRVNPKEWENVKGLLDKVDGLKEEIRKLYPELEGDDLYDEMLAMFSGREGTKKLEDVCRKLAAEDGRRVTDSAREQGFIDRVKTALQKFWKATADLLHIHFTSAEDVADKVLADWARGYDPREKEKKTDGDKPSEASPSLSTPLNEEGEKQAGGKPAKKPKTDNGTLLKGEKWAATPSPEKFRTRKKGDSHDVIWDIAGKSYGSTTAERDLIEAVVDRYGSYIGAWNAYEEGKIMMNGNEAAILKALVAEQETGGKLRFQKAEADERTRILGEISDNGVSEDELPKDMAYRTTDANEVADIFESGGMREIPEDKTVEGSERYAGRFEIGRTKGRDHGGKGFSKGKVWKNTAGGTAQKIIIGVPGDKTQWREGFHGKYTKPKSFGDIDDGKPLLLKFDKDGRVEGLSLADMRFWVWGRDGKFYELTPKKTYSKAQADKREVALRDAVVDRLREGGMDVSMDTEKGQRVLDEVNGKAKPQMGDASETFAARQKQAVEDRGVVMPDLNEASVKVVNDIPRHGYQGSIADATREAIDAAKQKYVGKVQTYNNYGKKFEYTISGNAIEICLSPKHQRKSVNKGVHLALAEHIDEVIDNSIEVEEHPDYVKVDGKRDVSVNDNALMHRFYGVTVIDGKPYRVMTLMREEKNSATNNGIHSYEVQKIEVLDNESPSTSNGVGSQSQSKIGSSYPLAKLLKGVEKAHDKGKYLLDESEKRSETVREHRVYHGSGADFDRFDHSHMGEGEGAQAFGWGTYVTEVEGIGRAYAEQNSKKFDNPVVQKMVARMQDMMAEGKTFEEAKSEALERMRATYEKVKGRDGYGSFIADYEKLKGMTESEFQNRHLYTVEIPDDTGENYLDWNGHPTDGQLEKIRKRIEADGWMRTNDGHLVRLYKDGQSIVLNGRAKGKDLYEELKDGLGSDKKASEFLSSLGFTGIKYPADFMRGGREDGKQNYVIFNEGDAKITDHVRFFRTADGEAYGYTIGGKIYIDPRIANSETPIHEYAHLWATALRNGNAEEWKNVVELMKDTKVWDEVRKRYPELEAEDDIADEVLATYSGRRGAERLRGEMDGADGKAKGALGRVKQALQKFWKGVADMLHIHYTSAEDVADRVMKDLLDGVDPRKLGSVSNDPIKGMERAAEAYREEQRLKLQKKNGEEDEMFVSLQNKKGKEYYDTVTELARRVSEGKARIERLGNASEHQQPTGYIEAVGYLLSGRVGDMEVFSGDARAQAESGWDKASEWSRWKACVEKVGDAVSTERGSISGVGEDTESFRRKVEELQERTYKSVEKWAANNGCLYNDADIKKASLDGKPIGEGCEAIVYRSNDGNRVVKTTHLDGFFANPLIRTLDKVQCFNDVFPESAYTIKGYGRDANNLFSVVMEQPYFEGKTILAHLDGDYEKANDWLDDYQKKIGFNFDHEDEWGNPIWSNGKYTLLDLNCENVIIDKDGIPHVIDCEVLPIGYEKMNSLKISNTASSSSLEGMEGTNVHYRTSTEQPRQSASEAHISATIDKVAQQTGGKVKQVHSVEEVDNEQVRKDIEDGKEVTGWYDEKTGEVHLYMPNIHDSYTAEKTVWHETVGHKGMRGLLGEKFHTYLRSLWMDMDNPVFGELHKYVRDRMAREPMSMYDAIEEFIAEAAEKGRGEAGFWNNIRNKVADALRSVGYRLCPNVKDVKYMLWLAKNVQKHPNDPVWKMRAEAAKWKIDHEKTEYTTAEGGEIRSVDGKSHGFESMTKAEWDEATDGQVHYRTSPSAATATDRYERMLSAHGYMATEAFADNMASVERLMRALDPTIKRIEDVSAAMNPYMLRTVLDGTASEKMQRFEADVMQPLDKYMARLIDAVDGKNDKEKIRNFNLYMIKKHGLERNRVFFVRDAVRNMAEAKRKQTLADFNQKRKDLGEQLRGGKLMLSQYYTQLDGWIRKNVNVDYKAGEHDYSGMHGLYGIGDKKSPYDDIRVQDEVMSAERAMEGMEQGSVEKFWGQMKVATQYALDEDYKNGFVTKANHESVSGMFDWYVPLRKFDEATAEDVYGYVTELGDSKTAIGPAIIKAKGRKSLSETNILAQIGAMANYAVVRGSQNKLKQAFALFVRNKGGQGLVTETKAWVEKVGTDMNGKDIWKEVFPDIEEGDTADEIANKVEAFEQDMEQKKAQGLAKNLTDRGDVGFKFERRTDRDQHFVDVAIAGKTHRFVINGNPRAAQALNGQLENAKHTDWLRRTAKSVTRFMAQMATSYNPEFVMRNAVRDAGFALQNVTAKEGIRYAAIYKGYYMKMLPVGASKFSWSDWKGSTGWGLYAKYRNGKLDMKNETEKWFKEFMENGGETGFVQIKNLQQWEKQYKRDILRERSLSAKSAKALKEFFIGNVECANEVVENMARFAAYCASRKVGRSVQRCAYDAKQVSVNFNRHGSGDAIGSFMTPEMGKGKQIRRNIYGFFAGYFRNYSMFFNAGVQGTQLMFSNVKKAPVATIGTMMAMPFAFGMATAMVNAWLIGSEDEKKRKGVKDPYAELPDYIRRNNLCIYLGEGKFVTIPLAIEHRAFYGLGDIVASLTTSPRLRNERNAAMDMTGCLSQLFPVVDFMNSAQFDKHPVLETAKGVLPTTVAPFAEWLMNSDWKGAPIRRVGDYTENRPSWKNAYSSTPERLMELNKWANAATNDVDPGNPNMKGSDFADAITDPSMLNHIIGTLGGGAITTTMRTANAMEKGRDTEWSEVPIGRNFMYTPNERTGMARTKARWYNYVEAANKTMANYDELGNKNVPVDERIANIAARFKFENTDEYRKVDIIKRTQKQLKRMRKLRGRSLDDKAVTDALDEQMNLVIQDAVSRLEEFDK